MKKDLPELSAEAQALRPGRYRHYRGGEYEVVGVGRLEADLAEIVIYKAAVDGTLWVRPLADFLGIVETSRYSGPRFVKINE